MSQIIIQCKCGDCGACDAQCRHGFLDMTCKICGPELVECYENEGQWTYEDEVVE